MLPLMVRRTLSFASLSLLLAVGGCGGGSDTSAAEKPAPTDAAAGAIEPADSVTDVSVAVGDSGDTVAPPVEVSDTAAEDDGASGGNPALANLPALDTESMCALLPSAETEAIVGPLGESGGNVLEGLGTNCYYEIPDDFKVLTSVEFSALTWTMNAEIAASVPADPPPTPCTIAGRDAECTESYFDAEADYTFDARVTVKIGGDSDPTMNATAPTLDQAIAIAELALSKLAL
jgi:hypothetical protein